MSESLPTYPPLSVEDSEKLVALARRFVRSWSCGDKLERRNARAAFDRRLKGMAVDPLHLLTLHVVSVDVARYLEERAMG